MKPQCTIRKKCGNYKLDKFRVYQVTYPSQINLIIHEKNVIGNISQVGHIKMLKNVFTKYIFIKHLDFFRGTRPLFTIYNNQLHKIKDIVNDHPLLMINNH